MKLKEAAEYDHIDDNEADSDTNEANLHKIAYQAVTISSSP